MTQKEKYYYKKSIGLCTYGSCTNPNDGGTLCEYHRTKERLRKSKRKTGIWIESKSKSVLEKKSENTLHKFSEINAKARELHMTYGEYMASMEVKA